MCGIAGCLLKEGSPSRETLKRAARLLAPRGPDDEGLFVEDRVGLVHRRLAIIDLEGGRQPLKEASGRVTVVFNGEIYNYALLRRELEAKGEVFRTRSDTEVLAVLLRRRWEGALGLLRGMFALAAYDAREKSLLLSRDRVGKKPLFYAENERGFFFASELPALLALLEKTPPVLLHSLELYLALRYVPAPYSIFSGIKRLLPGEYLVVKEGKVVKRGTFAPAFYQGPVDLPLAEARERLRELFLEAVRLRLVADVPVGAFLSGGIDSSLVVAAMAREKEKVLTFSVGFREASSELPYAREVAKRLGTLHRELVLGPESLAELPAVIKRLAEPFANETALLCYLLSKLARKHVKVVLTGDGGDEVFGGYRRYQKFLKKGLLERLLPGRRDGVERYVRLIFLFGRREREEILRRESTFPEEFIRNLWEVSPAEDALLRMQHLDLKTYLPGDILFYTDHMTMSFGLEARAPFLDQELIPFGLGLPRTYKLRDGKGKYILRGLFPEILPEKLFERRKRGFSPPLKRWLEGPFEREMVESLAEAPPLFKELVNPAYVRKLIEGKRTGERAKKLFSLYVLAKFFENFSVTEVHEGP